MTVLTVSDLSKSFDDVSVLTDLSVSVDDGEVFGLLGPNGAGKTTTINILTGVLKADSGDVSVLGQDPAVEPVAVRDTVGILPEKESPPYFLTPNEYFSFVAGVRGLDEDVVADRVADWAARLNFEEKLDTLCKDLSRGQQQKVMLTQAFLHEPDLVFIDEPLANLDPLMQDEVKQFIKEYHQAGNTLVLSTHHLEVAEELCTTVGILYDGAVAETVDPEASEQSLHDVFRSVVEQHQSDRGEN